ncbi:MAG: disulfide bond formation protein B [Rickettsiales bacterium]|nr:disulfide bond formation protein B [Rickettsiales bacterium]
MSLLASLRTSPLQLSACLAALALGGALLSQYGFGLHPCDLCIYQRYPYGAILALSLFALASRRIMPKISTYAALFISLLFLLDGGIAAYHVGVEQGWISGPTACSGATTGVNIEAVRTQLMQAALVSCKDAGFVWLGLSMAAWNLLYALASVGLVIYTWKRQPKDRSYATR